MWLAHVAVEGVKVKVELAQVLGLKGGYLQFNRQQAIEAAMEEQQVEREILTADLHRVFGADVAEVAPQFGQEPSEIQE